jgi:hypothetical protein
MVRAHQVLTSEDDIIKCYSSLSGECRGRNKLNSSLIGMGKIINTPRYTMDMRSTGMGDYCIKRSSMKMSEPRKGDEKEPKRNREGKYHTQRRESRKMPKEREIPKARQRNLWNDILCWVEDLGEDAFFIGTVQQVQRKHSKKR